MRDWLLGKRIGTSNRQADSLLALSEKSNGTQYCEPQTGAHHSTDLTTAGKSGGNKMCCFRAGEEIATQTMPVIKHG